MGGGHADHDGQIMNLWDYHFAPLSRGLPIPGWLRRGFFGFDPVTDEQIQQLMGKA